MLEVIVDVGGQRGLEAFARSALLTEYQRGLVVEATFDRSSSRRPTLGLMADGARAQGPQVLTNA